MREKESNMLQTMIRAVKGIPHTGHSVRELDLGQCNGRGIAVQNAPIVTGNNNRVQLFWSCGRTGSTCEIRCFKHAF